ncbi:unnamed protein product [Rhizophagus irregularis]|nr:unnamed protein product [Rhizophagus irregularis]
MAFRKPHPRQRRTCEEYKAELEEENYHLRSELQAKVDSNCQNEKQIRELERECVHYEQEIQTLNGEIERLENASKEEIAELKSEISSLKKQLYQAKKDIRDNEKHISSIESLLVDSEEQVKKLRCRIRTISSRKNSPERGNSPDLYNSDDNMATITELANAIDGYLNNRTTTRDILIDQIKRATRQIRRKENNLHQDLVREQRRRYDAEGERDLAITRRDLAEGGWLMLLRNAHHLQLSRGDIGLLEFNRDRLYERYEKWKNKTQAERQNNLNLQGQILALQNNPLNIQQIGMVGIRPPILWTFWRDPEDWLRDMQRYIIASSDNVAPGAGIKAAAEIGRIGAGIATGANIIPNGTWDENWSIAGGEPVDNAPVAPNAELPIQQLNTLKQTAVFGQLMQGDMSVEQFLPELKRLDNITKALAEAEKFTLSQKSAPSSLPIFPTANPYADTNRSGGGMTKMKSRT